MIAERIEDKTGNVRFNKDSFCCKFVCKTIEKLHCCIQIFLAVCGLNKFLLQPDHKVVRTQTTGDTVIVTMHPAEPFNQATLVQNFLTTKGKMKVRPHIPRGIEEPTTTSQKIDCFAQRSLALLQSSPNPLCTCHSILLAYIPWIPAARKWLEDCFDLFEAKKWQMNHYSSTLATNLIKVFVQVSQHVVLI